MDVLLVAHFHWDREWYRSFQVFRSRLVDAIDAVLDLCAEDPGYRFVLDGQAVVLDDYAEIRPERVDELRALLASGRLTAGPWYVQPDSLLPGGEAHVRNLLLGRRVTQRYGPVSRVAYVPDSFGHPARFPLLFAGFGLGPFVYWRGHGDELDSLGGPGARWVWVAPDGTTVDAWHLGEGYFSAAALDADGDARTTAERLLPLAQRLARAAGGVAVLMQGFDHLPPDRTTPKVAAALADLAGGHVRRGVLDDLRARPMPAGAPRFCGDLVGGRVANLLPGVWSSRMPLKLRNRRCETLLVHWAEPWAAFGALLGLRDERAALDAAWRPLLQNQAHDSIGGCSTDEVHEQMRARYDASEGLARVTVQRVLDRLAGRDDVRNTPWQREQTVTVFNASPHPRTVVARVALEGFPPWRVSVGRFDAHPLELAGLDAAIGFEVDGRPARVVDDDDTSRVRFLGTQRTVDVEFVAEDVPAFGCRTYTLVPAAAVLDEVDDGRTISAGGVSVTVDDDATLSVVLGGRTYRGLFGVEDCVDLGDSYDADPDPPRALTLQSGRVARTRHPSGIERLRVERSFAAEAEDAPLWCAVEATVAPGVPTVAVRVEVDNTWTDHRLRLRFPTGAPVEEFRAATTLGTATRPTHRPEPVDWSHPAPTTFPHQGWIAANGLVVGAPGLPEAEVTPAGEILVTLVRSIGWLARLSCRTRPVPAGPEMRAPGAQTLGTLAAQLALGKCVRDVRDAEIGSWSVLGGPDPKLAPGTSVLALEGDERLELHACKPADDGTGDRGVVVRIVNPTAEPLDATLHWGLGSVTATAVRLDETPAGDATEQHGGTVTVHLPPHAVRTVRCLPVRRIPSAVVRAETRAGSTGAHSHADDGRAER